MTFTCGYSEKCLYACVCGCVYLINLNVNEKSNHNVLRELDNCRKRIIYGYDDRHDIHFIVFVVYFEKFIFCTVFKRGTNMKFDILPSTFVMEDTLTTYT